MREALTTAGVDPEQFASQGAPYDIVTIKGIPARGEAGGFHENCQKGKTGWQTIS